MVCEEDEQPRIDCPVCGRSFFQFFPGWTLTWPNMKALEDAGNVARPYMATTTVAAD